MLAVDIEKRLGEFDIKVAFESKGSVTALFGSSGSGKTSIVNMVAGLVRPDRGRIALDDMVLFDSNGACRTCRCTAAASATCSRRAACFLTWRSPPISITAAACRVWRGMTPSSDASSTCSTSATCSTAGPESSPAANASASPSAARC